MVQRPCCLQLEMATSTSCSFWQKVVVINLFCILLSRRSAAGNMPVGGLKPHVLGELGLGICFNLSIFDILNLKQELALLFELGFWFHFSASLCSSVVVARCKFFLKLRDAF